MYTKARIAGHPIHPMLVAFPIGLYAATVAGLLAFIGTKDIFFFRAAMTANIAGIVMAAVAVIPGVIDLFSLSARSRARTVGYQHAAANVVALAMFAISAVLLYQRWTDRALVDGVYALDATTPLALALVGIVATVIAGGLGWTLVQTYHVGVKPRFDRPAPSPRDVELEFEDDDLITPVTSHRDSRSPSHLHH